MVMQDEAVSRAAASDREAAVLKDNLQRAEDRLREVTRTLAELEERKRRADDKLNKSTAALGQNVSTSLASSHNTYVIHPAIMQFSVTRWPFLLFDIVINSLLASCVVV